MQHFLVIFKNSFLAFCHDNKCHYLNAYIIVIHYISVNFNNCHLDSVTFNFVSLKIILFSKNGVSKVLNKLILEESWNKWRNMFRKIQTFLSIVDKIAQFKLIFLFRIKLPIIHFQRILLYCFSLKKIIKINICMSINIKNIDSFF